MAGNDREVAILLHREQERQHSTINLIAAENYASQAVLEAQGSVFTNKYAEGYPGHRYYAGCEVVDQVEALAIERAKRLFRAEHANVQPHSGSQANQAAYLCLLQPGETALAMSLAHGGHLTHGSPVNFSGRFYHFVYYGVDPATERLNYDQIEKLAREHHPRLIVAGASAYPRVIEFEPFRRIADAVGARLLVDMAHLAGLVAGGVHPSPIPYAEVVTSTSHKTLRGPRGGFILCRREMAATIDAAVFPGIQGGPLVHAIAAKAVAFEEAMQPPFADYARRIVANARALAQALQELGLKLFTGGTDNHLMLVDVRPMDITGRQAEEALSRAGIIVNRNAIPFDPHPPGVASGIRLGTPAVTTRGMGEAEMAHLARLVFQVLSHHQEEKSQELVRGEVLELCRRFPIPRG